MRSGPFSLYWGILLILYGAFLVLKNRALVSIQIPWLAILLIALGGSLIIVAWQMKRPLEIKKKAER